MRTIDELDRYLLTGGGDKKALIAALLAGRSSSDTAAPFYRALEVLSERTPDDALIALRIALAGSRPEDANVLELRALVASARSASSESERTQAQQRYHAALAG